MKKLLTLLFLLSSFYLHAQIGFSSKPYSGRKKVDKEVYENFKKSTTIFILSDVYDNKTYDKILKKSWKVTPYEIVNLKDFSIENYLNGNYSFIDLYGAKVKTQNTFYLYFNTRLISYDNGKIKDRFKKLRSQNKLTEEKYKKTISNNTNILAISYLSPKENFVNQIRGGERESIVKEMYSQEVFQNYLPGFLQNYFQKLSNLLETREAYWLYSENKSEELAKLAEQKLYVPSYLNMKFNPLTAEDRIMYSEYTKDLFKKYKYEFQIEKADTISNRIMDGEEFYYLRYCRMNTDRFIQIVNSITGETIYKEYAPLGYNLKPKHFKAISNAIKKATKK
ncbi:hypothetical protein [uncultured Tenacibaculum sp.]|uniref:hypothetical protein n=1 Tax=uncultured Tenacibaculum sp. TaxID=174713 RepID=UPI002632A9BB|nr:hypothetical protein [uncultured Tenacibaculum sp.]